MRKMDYLWWVEGRSLALLAGYKPEVLLEFAYYMVREVSAEYLEISDVLEDVCDAYEKLGYMFYAKKNVDELNPKIPYYGPAVQYHVINFIFDCKAFLDSISNAIYHAFDLDIRKKVNIDMARPEFNRKLTQKKPRMADRISPFLDWAKYVANYRTNLIHKYGLFGLSKNLTFTKFEIMREPVRPLMFFDKELLDPISNELKRKYGSSTIQVDDFCEEHLDNAKKLFETILVEFLEEIRREGPDIFGWERIHPTHMEFMEFERLTT